MSNESHIISPNKQKVEIQYFWSKIRNILSVGIFTKNNCICFVWTWKYIAYVMN